MSFRANWSVSGQSTINYLTVPDPDLLFIPPQSPGSESVPGSLSRTIPQEQWRRASSTTSSIFDMSNEAEQLEQALQDNDILTLTKILKLHHAKFPVRMQCGSIMEKCSFDSRSQRFSHGSQAFMEQNDRRESVVTDNSDVPLIFRRSLHVAIQNESMEVLRILLEYGIDPNTSSNGYCVLSRRNSLLQDVTLPSSNSKPSSEGTSDKLSKFDSGSPLPFSLPNVGTRVTSSDQQSPHLKWKAMLQKSNKTELPLYRERSDTLQGDTKLHFDFSFNYSQEELMNLPSLYIAVIHGNEQIVQMLLDHGANPNVQDRHGVTPLHLAVSAEFYNPESVQNLLSNGAKITIHNHFGMSPYHLRPNLKKEQRDIVQCMLTLGPLVKSTPNRFDNDTSQVSSASSTNSVSRFFNRLNSDKRSKFKDKRITYVEIESDLAERASSTSSYRSARSHLQSARFSITEDTETDVSMQQRLNRSSFKYEIYKEGWRLTHIDIQTAKSRRGIPKQ